MFQIEERSFKKKISLLDTIILGIGSTIGAGIFILLSPSIKIAGPGVIIAFIINTFIALIIAGNYAEAASHNPIEGGGFSFVEAVYGKKALFLGWMVWLGNTSYAALTAVGIGEYLSAILPVNELIISFIILGLFTLLNSIGSKSVASIERPLTISLVLALIITALVLFASPMNGTFTPLIPNGGLSILSATSLLFLVFIGFEAITTISAEISKPSKNIPKALFYTVAFVALLYLIIVISTIYSTNYEVLGNTKIALVKATEHLPIMEGVITMAAIMAMLSSLNIALMAGARNVYALSRDGFLNKKWGRINERFESPLNAVLLTAGLGSLLILSDQVEFIASVSNIAYMLVVASVGLAVIKMRKGEKKGSGYQIPLYPYSSYLCVGLPLILIPFLEHNSILVGFGWLIIGVMIYLFTSRRAPKSNLSGK